MRIPVALYLLALAVRAALVALFPDPGYPDSFYYVDVARSLARGDGFNVDFVWIFAEVGGTIPETPVLPIPSNAHWTPLASLVQVPFILWFGETGWASALPFALVGSTAAPLAWALARDAGATEGVARGAGVLTAVPGLSLVYMAQPDNFSLYQPVVAAALWMAARGLKGSRRSFVAAGLLAGVATLSRNDGVLVLVAIGVAFGWDRWSAWRSGGRRVPSVALSAAIGGVAAFAVVLAPWLARQVLVFDTLSPSSASGKVLFIRDIAEWNSITVPANLDHLLGMGALPLLVSRIGGLIAALLIFAVTITTFILVPFLVIGAWTRRRSIDFRPFFLYAAGLFAFSSLVSAVHVPGGTFIHSAVALAPHTYVLALEGLAAWVAWIAARRPGWHRRRATAVLTGALIGFSVVASLVGAAFVQDVWARSRSDFVTVADALDGIGAPRTDRVMSIDASGTRYWSGRGGVVLVNDPLETIEAVAHAYDIRWLVLDRGSSVDAVAPILDATERPDWLGPPIYAEGDPVRLAVFPIVIDE